MFSKQKSCTQINSIINAAISKMNNSFETLYGLIQIEQ